MAPDDYFSLGHGCWRLKCGGLLAKGEVFEHQTAARPKPAKHGSEPEPKQVKHGNKVIAGRLCRFPCEAIDFTAGPDCDEAQPVMRTNAISWTGAAKQIRQRQRELSP
jgi:hypothetical protein